MSCDPIRQGARKLDFPVPHGSRRLAQHCTHDVWLSAGTHARPARAVAGSGETEFVVGKWLHVCFTGFGTRRVNGVVLVGVQGSQAGGAVLGPPVRESLS